MRLLFIGDVVGKGGRRAVREIVPELKRDHNCQFCVVNAENAAGGAGLTSSCVKELLEHADVLTTGDHVWDQKEFERDIRQFKRVLRPANFSDRQPGVGHGVFRNPAGGDVMVVNLAGTVFMRPSARCPFETIDDVLEQAPPSVRTIIVDFHAEATSEKGAMARYLDGKVTAVVGTHTHVRTGDAQILPGKTAFVTDAGMVGSNHSVLGRDPEAVIDKFRSGMPRRLKVVEKDIRLDAVIITYDETTGRAGDVESISVTAQF